jgi:hypothetical protein
MKSTILLSAVALSAGLIMSGGTRAEEGLVGQLGFFGVGKAYEIEKGHFFWVGEFSGTFFSDKGEKGVFDHAGVKCPAWDDSDVNNKKDKAGGYCTFTDLSGDQAYMTWQDGGSTEVGARNPGTYTWTGGTGKYKEIKGNGVYFAVTSVNWPDGTASGYSVMNR